MFMIIYLSLIVIALLNHEPVSAFVAFVCGIAVLAMYKYGGERLRKILSYIY